MKRKRTPTMLGDLVNTPAETEASLNLIEPPEKPKRKPKPPVINRAAALFIGLSLAVLAAALVVLLAFAQRGTQVIVVTATPGTTIVTTQSFSFSSSITVTRQFSQTIEIQVDEATPETD
jgi:cell division septal protein FtsQ